MILSIIVTISALLFCRLLQIWLKYRFHPVPSHPWPIWKDENAKVVRDSLQNGSLPKILRPEMFPFSSYSKSYIFTDLEVIKEAFVHKELCHRDSTEESRIDNQYDQEYIGLDKLAVEELGQEDTLIKNGPGNFVGMGDGPYDEVHKLFRKMWYQTQQRLTGKNRMREIIEQSSSVVNNILFRDGSGTKGIDPKQAFVNGTVNVVNEFSFGLTFDYDDPIFQSLTEDMKTCVEAFTLNLLKRTAAGKLPLWLSQNFLVQAFWQRLLKDRNEATYRFYKFIYKQVKKHRIALDVDNPGDFLDMMLIAAETEPGLGFDVVAGTVFATYAGASDTLANQLHWFCVILADHPDVQEKIHAELVASLESENEIKKDKCPFTRSVLLEVQRINPVIDTLIHRSSADIVVDGVLIEKGSTMQGSVYAVLHNPRLFPEPERFKADRFYKEGEFVNDIKVIAFGLGLRNCPGKQIAADQYWIFATNIIRDFRLSRSLKSMEIARHRFVRMPKCGNVRFMKRE